MPQQTAQIVSPLAGQKRAGFRLSQIGQDTDIPFGIFVMEQNTPSPPKSKNVGGDRTVWTDAVEIGPGYAIGRKGP